MKKLFQIAGLCVLLGLSGSAVWAQNAQKEIEEMYQQRERKERLDEAIRKAEEERKERLDEAIRKAAEEREKAHKESSQKEWESLLGKNAHIFDRERTEQAFSAYLNFQDIYAWKKEKERKEQINKGLGLQVDWFWQMEDPYEIKFITEPIYLPIIKKAQSGFYTEKSWDTPITFDFVSSMQITDGPFLLLRKEEQCLLLDSQYNVHELRHCEDYTKYLPVSEERKQVLQELGFSDETIERYALKNPWNLSVYTACDVFVPTDTPTKVAIELVEKVVVAWRYDELCLPSSVQQRYILIKKDGEEKEVPPGRIFSFPKCFDLNKKEREAFYESLTQPQPYPEIKPRKAWTPTRGCLSVRWEEDTLLCSWGNRLKEDEKWFF